MASRGKTGKKSKSTVKKKPKAKYNPEEWVERPPSAHLLAKSKFADVDAVLHQLQLGADVNCRDNDGKTPLHWSCVMGHEHVTEALIASGADINAPDAFGWTALHLATANDFLPCVQVLLAAQAEVNPSTFLAETPLDLAIKHALGHIKDVLVAADAMTQEQKLERDARKGRRK